MRRTTSFGFGNRFMTTERHSSPPPNSYNLPALFNMAQLKGNAYTFGVSREAVRKVFIKTNPTCNIVVPGPGTYDVRTIPGKDTKKYTMRTKVSTISIYNSIK